MWPAPSGPETSNPVVHSASMGGVTVQGTTATGSIIRFGAYEVDLQRGELRKNGLKVRLQGQPFQVLSILLKHPGELVTREDLRVTVWPLDTFVDFDHALNTAVKKIRAALGDEADNPRFIETVPRRGYRFIAPVEHASGSVPVAAPPVRPSPYRIFAIVGVVAVVLAVAGLAWKVVPRHAEKAVTPEFQRLTFDIGELGDARFMPDGSSIVYSAGWPPHKIEMLVQRLGAPVPQQLDVQNTMLLAISRTGELAVLKMPRGVLLTAVQEKGGGILARMTPGGAPRELLPDVEDADWSPDGQLAVVHRIGGKSRLEFPIGNVLYENSGWIANPRFSPDGSKIAFLDHPGFPDDRGYVAVLDLKGTKKTLSGLWESERGLAWSPNGQEVWFAAARSGVERALYAVDLSGNARRVLAVAGGLTLQDIAPDGRVLLDRDNEHLGILFMGPGDKAPRDLSWLDWSIAVDVSSDGKQILFDEEGGDSGPSYQVGLRPTDGSPAVMLGPGNAQALSPDGKWALSITPSPEEQILLLPTGPGNSKSLERGPIEHYSFVGARWFADGKQIIFTGNEPGQGRRCYVQSVDGGAPRAVTPAGVDLCLVSPRGAIFAMTQDLKGELFTSKSAQQPERVFSFEPGENPFGWSQDGRYIFVAERAFTDQTSHAPLSVIRVDVTTGRRQLWKQLALPDTSTVIKTEAVITTPDGSSYAYSYSRHFSDIYEVKGLK